jgi:predicted enzyme related to lactoylglutathione lyase/quinol monooxygenase YgiN
MKAAKTAPVHLISRWILLKGREKEGIAALKKLASEVLAQEPGTLIYRVHTPIMDDAALVSLPTSVPQEVVFYEAYSNAQAFDDHVNGPRFTKFVQDHGKLFLAPSDSPGKPFIRVQFLELQTGFIREAPRVNGVALYRIEPTGRLTASWTVADRDFAGKTGIEIAEKKGSAKSGLAGPYNVRIWGPGTPMAQAPIFTGTLSIKALPGGTDPQMESYELAWTTPGSTEAYAGLGLRRKDSDQLTASYWNVVPPEPTLATPPAPTNHHPSVMFEIIAKKQGPMLAFYRSLFGWNYQFGTGNFAYVRFPSQPQPLLGGIGQADPSIPGFEPGRTFYLLVDDLQATLDEAGKLGGSTYVGPTEVDGYHFAMMKDPEGNIVGLVQPFTSETGPQGTKKVGKPKARKASK